MTRHIVVGAVMALAVVVRSNGQLTDALPAAARRAMDSVRPGWGVAPISEQLLEDFRASTMSPEPNVLAADFDGNGEIDYAVLANVAEGGELRTQLVAILQTQRVFRVLAGGPALEVDRNRYLVPVPRGTRLWDLDRGEEFVCGFDAIGVHYDCCGCTTYIFKAGAFQSFWTCD
jgi:hypothetical protein